MRMLVTVLFAVGILSWSQTPERHTDVHGLYLQDQSDRGVGTDKAALGWQELVKRDTARRQRVHEMIASGALSTAQDFHDAAFIFQHSVETENYPPSKVADDLLLAHVLASVAVAKGDRTSLWISAASLDRYLQSIGRPQIFGTQYSSKDDQPYTQEPYSRALLPDALRLVFCVPGSAQQAQNLKAFNAGQYPAGILPEGCSR
jgi:hypothetical protein